MPAAALRLLSRLWGVELSKDALVSLALDLGADVPVCLLGRASNVSGVGEILSDAPPLPPAWLVLANPLVGVATPEVFKARRGRFNQSAPLKDTPHNARALADALGPPSQRSNQGVGIPCAPRSAPCWWTSGPCRLPAGPHVGLGRNLLGFV